MPPKHIDAARPLAPDDRRSRGAQRAILLLLLDDEHPAHWSHSELCEALQNPDPAPLDAAVADLLAHGAVCVEGERVSASPCVRHLDALGLLAV